MKFQVLMAAFIQLGMLGASQAQEAPRPPVRERERVIERAPDRDDMRRERPEGERPRRAEAPPRDEDRGDRERFEMRREIERRVDKAPGEQRGRRGEHGERDGREGRGQVFPPEMQERLRDEFRARVEQEVQRRMREFSQGHMRDREQGHMPGRMHDQHRGMQPPRQSRGQGHFPQMMPQGERGGPMSHGEPMFRGGHAGPGPQHMMRGQGMPQHPMMNQRGGESRGGQGRGMGGPMQGRMQGPMQGPERAMNRGHFGPGGPQHMMRGQGTPQHPMMNQRGGQGRGDQMRGQKQGHMQGRMQGHERAMNRGQFGPGGPQHPPMMQHRRPMPGMGGPRN